MTVRYKRVKRLADGQVDPECDVVRTFAEAIEIAHDPEQVGDIDQACVALLEPLIRSGWWEAAIHLAWPNDLDDFAPFHIEALAWWSDIPDGKAPKAFAALWPRDTGKSTLTMRCFAIATAVKRRPYLFWMSEAFDQVTDKVAGVGELLNAPRMAAAFPDAADLVTDREGRLQTRSGVTIDAGGMDQALRGRLIVTDRPGVIVLDDVESNLDTKYKRAKKLTQVTETIIPMGSDDCAVLFVQNLIHEDSLASELASGEAEWLADRVVSGPWPQVRDMEVETERLDDGSVHHSIVGGVFTWPEGRGLVKSEDQLNKMGPTAFRREHNHDLSAVEGDMFIRELWGEIGVAPDGLTMCRAWDLAASEEATADWTVGALMGIHKSGRVYVVDVVRGQWLGGRVEELVAELADEDVERYGRCQVVIEGQVAAAGKTWNERWAKDVLPDHRLFLSPAQGNKPFKADGYSNAQQKGLVTLVAGPWNEKWKKEHALFTSDGTIGKHDDQVDAGAMGFNWLTRKGRRSTGSVGSAARRHIG